MEIRRNDDAKHTKTVRLSGKNIFIFSRLENTLESSTKLWRMKRNDQQQCQ